MRILLLLHVVLLTVKSWSQTPDLSPELNFDLSKGFAALEHLQYERAHQAFNTVWQRTVPDRNGRQQYLSQHLFACEGLAWVYYGRMDANPDSVSYFTQLPYLPLIDPLHQFRLGYVQARALLPKYPNQALHAFQQLLQKQVKTPEQAAQLWYHIGVCHQDLKQWHLAEEAFKRCLQMLPKSGTWVIGRGQLPFIAQLALVDVALKMQQVKIAELALARSQNSKSAGFQPALELYARRGELAIVKQDFSAALLHFQVAVQTLENWIKKEQFLEQDEAMLREDYAHIFSNAAWCALQLGQVYPALNWIEKGKNQLLQRQLLSPGTPEITAAQVQKILQSLQPAYTILRYFQARDSIFAAVLSTKSCHIQAVSDTIGLSQHIFDLNQLDPPQIDYAERFAYYSSWLYQFFVEPLEKKIHTKHLLIIPDGALNLVTFESLCTQPDAAKLPFLLRRYAIWYAPGLAFLQQEGQHAPRKQRWLGLGPSFKNHPSALPLLQFNQQELQQVCRLTGGLALLGNNAQKTKWLQQLPDYDHLHFSTHGVLSKYNSNHNQMILGAKDMAWDSLTVGEVKKLNLQHKDIVLSTCYAGLSRYILHSEEMNSLRRAFLSAGANSVLQSTWRLPDMASYVIISEYYAQLQQGKDQATALQAAKLRYLDATEELRQRYKLGAELALSPLPHHWHMIVGHGWPHRVRFVQNKQWMYLFLIILTGAAGLMLWKAQRKVQL